MTKLAEDTQITLRRVLYLTDFSEPSEAALPFALTIARDYGASIHALAAHDYVYDIFPGIGAKHASFR